MFWKLFWWTAAVVTALVFGVPFAHSADNQRIIECVGVMESRPVHIGDLDNPYLKYGHGNLVVTMNTGRKQSKDCDQWFEGKNWKKVKDACQEDKLCRVVGVIGPNGWQRIIKAEDYSEVD